MGIIKKSRSRFARDKTPKNHAPKLKPSFKSKTGFKKGKRKKIQEKRAKNQEVTVQSPRNHENP
ncbi:MAG: hypothetical protein VSS75_012125, partial [Candidatus Parabeggiatoa sp.]|nr:hypothetical protein [Candidatus Parabeggiatoa sp.]